MTRLWLVLGGLVLAPPCVQAQSVNPPSSTAAAAAAPVDPALRDLIPDSALLDPARWALDTDAAHRQPDAQTVPDVAWLNQPDGMPVADSVLGAVPGLTIAWPDSFALPPIQQLSADPDIAVVAAAAHDAETALDVALPRGAGHGPLGSDALVRHVAPGIDLVLPHDSVFPELADLSDRFAALSSLRALGRGDDNLAQLTRRARDDVALLQQILRLYGYYDATVSQNLIGILATTDGAVATAKDHGQAMPQASVRFELVPGRRYSLGAMDLGDLGQSPDRTKLIAALALKSGDPANTEAVLAARARLYDALTHTGHAFAKVGDPALDVDHQTFLANLTLPVTTGGQYVFGAVTSSLPAFLNAHHLQIGRAHV